MENNSIKVVGGAVSLVALIIIAGALLVPVINSYTSEETTNYNDGMRASVYQEGDEHTIILTSGGITTDGEEIQPLPDTTRYGEATLFIASNAIVRLDSNNSVNVYMFISGNYVYRAISDLDEHPITCTITSNGEIALVPEEGISRAFGGVIIYPDTKGDYALTYNPNIVENSIVYGGGNTTQGTVIYGLRFNGTTDNLDFTLIAPSSSAVQDYEVNLINTTTNLYKINSIKILASDAEPIYYSYFFAPYAVEYENPEYVGDNVPILSVIPLIIIIAILVFAINVYIKKDD